MYIRIKSDIKNDICGTCTQEQNQTVKTTCAEYAHKKKSDSKNGIFITCT